MVVRGDEFRRAQREIGLDPERHETALELTYRAQITDWFGLQPDIQYIINPGLDSELDNAFVYGFRFDVVFGKTW